MKRGLVVVVAVAALMAADNVVSGPTADATTGSQIQQFRVKVLDERVHDPNAFTQGFEIADNVLYESTGLVGHSTIRATNVLTGAVIKQAKLKKEFFGEGATVVGNRIWQLTWTHGTALLWDRARLTLVGVASYTGEGWGLCYDGRRLIMSDGSDVLTFRDPKTFVQTGKVNVNVDGVPVTKLNELECTSQGVWANIWGTERIIRIDPRTGSVAAVVDASGLFSSGKKNDVLNGIAAIPCTKEFLITGKRWPKMFRVRFVPTAFPLARSTTSSS